MFSTSSNHGQVRVDGKTYHLRPGLSESQLYAAVAAGKKEKKEKKEKADRTKRRKAEQKAKKHKRNPPKKKGWW